MTSRRVALGLATWGGCGYFPVGPGTVGSAGALGLGYLAWTLAGADPGWLAAAAGLLFWPGAWAAEEAGKHFGNEDSSQVVVDEVIGQWLALAAINPRVWWHWVAAFLLFRAFDIVKPYPIRKLEKLPAGWGVVADDAAAGLCVMMILAGFRGLAV